MKKLEKFLGAGLITLMLMSMLTASIPTVSAVSPSPYEHYNIGADDVVDIVGVDWSAQTFTVGATGHSITSIKVKLARVGNPDTCAISIRAVDENGHPAGSDLTSTNFNGNILDNIYPEWYEFSVPEYTLSANTKYAIVLRAPSGNDLNKLWWYADTSDPTYTEGNYEMSPNSGSSWTAFNVVDFMFEIWGNTPPTAPTSLILTAPIKVGGTLTATASGSTDADGDGITYYYKFYNDNDTTIRQNWSTTNTYAITVDDVHDNIKVYTKAYDGYEYSGEFENSVVVANTLPNKPTNLLPSARQVSTSVTISAICTDNDNDRINVFFYDNSTKTAIDNIWIDNGATATRTWSSLTRGQTYVFFAGAQDNNGAWGENSDTQSFLVNSLPVASITAPDNGHDAGVNVGISFTSSASDAENDNIAYSWNFGDGTGTSALQNPAYQYGGAGDYTVTLIVNDGYENSAPTSIIINVTGAGGPGGGGGGGGGGLPSGVVAVEEAQAPPVGNILFVRVFDVFGIGVQLWILIALMAAYGWWSEQRGIAFASLMMLGFLFVFGGNLLAMVGG